MGAWIETYLFQAKCARKTVAPFMGAWIETICSNLSDLGEASLPSWERGLKQ